MKRKSSHYSPASKRKKTTTADALPEDSVFLLNQVGYTHPFHLLGKVLRLYGSGGGGWNRAYSSMSKWLQDLGCPSYDSTALTTTTKAQELFGRRFVKKIPGITREVAYLLKVRGWNHPLYLVGYLLKFYKKSHADPWDDAIVCLDRFFKHNGHLDASLRGETVSTLQQETVKALSF